MQNSSGLDATNGNMDRRVGLKGSKPVYVKPSETEDTLDNPLGGMSITDLINNAMSHRCEQMKQNNAIFSDCRFDVDPLSNMTKQITKIISDSNSLDVNPEKIVRYIITFLSLYARVGKWEMINIFMKNEWNAHATMEELSVLEEKRKQLNQPKLPLVQVKRGCREQIRRMMSSKEVEIKTEKETWEEHATPSASNVVRNKRQSEEEEIQDEMWSKKTRQHGNTILATQMALKLFRKKRQKEDSPEKRLLKKSLNSTDTLAKLSPRSLTSEVEESATDKLSGSEEKGISATDKLSGSEEKGVSQTRFGSVESSNLFDQSTEKIDKSMENISPCNSSEQGSKASRKHTTGPRSNKKPKNTTEPGSNINQSENELYLAPLKLGFVRELVMRRNVVDKAGDIYYHSPYGGKLRSTKEVERFLEMRNIPGLTVENFTFQARLFGFGEPFELMRSARLNGEKSKTERKEANNPNRAQAVMTDIAKRKKKFQIKNSKRKQKQASLRKKSEDLSKPDLPIQNDDNFSVYMDIADGEQRLQYRHSEVDVQLEEGARKKASKGKILYTMFKSKDRKGIIAHLEKRIDPNEILEHMRKKIELDKHAVNTRNDVHDSVGTDIAEGEKRLHLRNSEVDVELEEGEQTPDGAKKSETYRNPKKKIDIQTTIRRMSEELDKQDLKTELVENDDGFVKTELIENYNDFVKTELVEIDDGFVKTELVENYNDFVSSDIELGKTKRNKSDISKLDNDSMMFVTDGIIDSNAETKSTEYEIHPDEIKKEKESPSKEQYLEGNDQDSIWGLPTISKVRSLNSVTGAVCMDPLISPEELCTPSQPTEEESTAVQRIAYVSKNYPSKNGKQVASVTTMVMSDDIPANTSLRQIRILPKALCQKISENIR